MTETLPGRFTLEFDADVDLDLAKVKGAGPKTVEKLAERGLGDLAEVLLHFPRKYRRTYRGVPAAEVLEAGGEYAQIHGRIEHVNPPPRYSRRPLEVSVDCDGQLFKLLWFNMQQAWFAKKFRVGKWIVFEGDIELERRVPRMTHPTFDILTSEPRTIQRKVTIEPIYSSYEGVNDGVLRKAVEHAADTLLEHVVEQTPRDVCEEVDLPTTADALRTIHLLGEIPELDRFERALKRSRDRLVFEEFYLLQRELAHQYVASRRAARAHACGEREMGRRFVKNLPFSLTGDQREAITQIADELDSRIPMRRLLQGDVGSGKTVVALMAAAIVIGSGHQVALMAPTDVLATQHLNRAREFFEGLEVEVALLTGSVAAAERRQILERLKSGEVHLIIGTHAIFQADVDFSDGEASQSSMLKTVGDLGLVIVDEQHKFGVEQRDALLAKGRDPHFLAMSATPIPRSLAHAVFGDLDLTIIREKPPGRKPVRTFLRDARARQKIFEFVANKAKAGEQAYIVYPLVEQSEALPSRLSVVDAAEDLANGALSELRVGVLHGRMASSDKLAVMQRFKDGEIDVLASTTVIEVGVDVPNASVMVIEHAELFGLSQLHQLRGRIGRGSAESMCIIVAHGVLTDDAMERLHAFVESDDGFELSEVDLAIRGPGLFLGARQSGAPEFRFGDVLRDSELLSLARQIARRRVLGDAGR